EGEALVVPQKKYHHGIIIGSLIFGFGWSLTGACPGPLYAQIGAGFSVVIVGLLAALAGTWTFGRFQRFLPD
ncbi:MAG TPA: transporter, partial [Cytophagales bacterium]|nr:transporter [Cytophagales bacterium]